MKQIICFLTVAAAMFTSLSVNAQDDAPQAGDIYPGASVALAKADSAYTADDFGRAIELYRSVMAHDGTSAALYYNLGNCYYRIGEMGQSVLAYEKALRLDPSYADARNNLAFVNARITDRPGERGTFLGNALDTASESMHSNTWAWTAFTFFILTLVCITAYVFSNEIWLRKVGFFGGIGCVIVCALGIWLALRSASIALSDEYAVIMSPSSILSTTPRAPQDRTQEAMLLHEGTKVHILDSVRSTTDSIPSMWYDVEVDNTHRAWINAADVQRI